MPGSGENYIYYIGAFNKICSKHYFIDNKNHELNAHQLTFTCAALPSARHAKSVKVSTSTLLGSKN